MSTPVPLPVLGGLTFVQIDVGYDHTVALTASGTAYAWGFNGSGQLGDGTQTYRAAPVPVQQGALLFVDISAGGLFTVARTATGAGYAWGANVYGQLGNGTTVSTSSPAPLSGGLAFKHLVAENNTAYTLAVTTAGAGYAWGLNSQGQLGDGSTTNRNSPTPMTGGLIFQ